MLLKKWNYFLSPLKHLETQTEAGISNFWPSSLASKGTAGERGRGNERVLVQVPGLLGVSRAPSLGSEAHSWPGARGRWVGHRQISPGACGPACLPGNCLPASSKEGRLPPGSLNGRGQEAHPLPSPFREKGLPAPLPFCLLPKAAAVRGWVGGRLRS